MKFNELLEALKPSQYRPLVKLQKEKYADLPEQIFEIHQAIFGDEHRVYYTLNGEKEHFIKTDQVDQKAPTVFKIDKLMHEVNALLTANGYIIEDINKNKAFKFLDLNTDKGKLIWSKVPEANKQNPKQYQVNGHIVYLKNNEFSIIKLLADKPELQKEYEAYYQRTQSKNKNKDTDEKLSDNQDDYLIVISRHAYDIAGASTDREWHSCMNIDDGINKHYIKYDIAGGNLVSYLIKKDDTNITHPLGRVLIKKYKSRRGAHYCLFPEQTCYSELHSQIIDKYKEVIQQILVKAQKETFEPELTYKFLKTKQYDDVSRDSVFVNKEGSLGVTEADKKTLSGIFFNYNEEVKKVAESNMSNMPVDKLIKHNLEDIRISIVQELDERFSSLDTEQQILKYGKDYIKLLKVGYKESDMWSGNPDIKSFAITFAKTLTKENVKIEYSKIDEKNKNTKDIKIIIPYFYFNRVNDAKSFEEMTDDDDTFNVNPSVTRTYDLSNIEMNKDYRDIVQQYVYDRGVKNFDSFDVDIKKNGKLNISSTTSFSLRIKNPFDEFLKWLTSKNRKIHVKEDAIYNFYQHNARGDRRNDYNKIDYKKWTEGFRSAGKIDHGWGPHDDVDEESVALLINDFITKKINKGEYNFDDFITLNDAQKKPVEDVLNDMSKEFEIDLTKLSATIFDSFANIGEDIYTEFGFEQFDKTAKEKAHINKLHNFYFKLRKEVEKNEKNSSYLAHVNKMIKDGLLKKEDIDEIGKMNYYDDEDVDKIKKVTEEFYIKYKAYIITQKAKWKKKGEIKENINDFYEKIRKLRKLL